MKQSGQIVLYHIKVALKMNSHQNLETDNVNTPKKKVIRAIKICINKINHTGLSKKATKTKVVAFKKRVSKHLFHCGINLIVYLHLFPISSRTQLGW